MPKLRAKEPRAPPNRPKGPRPLPIPVQFQGRLSVPAVAAPMFLVSNPDLVVESCRAGIIGTFPALNNRSSEDYEAWLVEIRERLDRIERDTGRPLRAVRRQPDRAQEQPAPAGRPRNLDQAQGAADHHVARRREGAGRRGARLWRARVPRRHQHAPRPQGGRSRRRRPDRGVRRRRRTCRPAQPVRADSGNPRVLRQDDPAVRRDVDRPPRRGRAHARRRPRLSRHALHRDAREHGAGRPSRT